MEAWDGSGWVTVGSVRGNDRAVRAVPLPNLVTTPKIRVSVLGARAHYSRIVEVEAIGCSSN